MKVVLDANIFIADYLMSGTAFRVMFDGLRRAGARLFIPTVVLEEVVNKYKEDLYTTKRILEKEAHRLRRLTSKLTVDLISDEDIGNQVQVYRRFFVRNIRATGGDILPFPNLGHDLIVDRELSRKKPFSDKGTGYRDFLIWESILQLLSGTEPVVFVTENTSDFAAKDGRSIHPDLVVDIQSRGFEPDSVILFIGLQSFVDAKIRKELEYLREVVANLKNGTYRGLDLRGELTKGLRDVLTGRELRSSRTGFFQTNETVTLVGVSSVREFEVMQAQRLSSGELLVSVEAKTECALDISPDVSAANSRGFWADSDTAVLDVVVDMTFDPNQLKVTSFRADLLPVRRLSQRSLSNL